jgi:hypothetical protein
MLLLLYNSIYVAFSFITYTTLTITAPTVSTTTATTLAILALIGLAFTAATLITLASTVSVPLPRTVLATINILTAFAFFNYSCSYSSYYF